jgi:prepilin-type N-terminal cleavage/methylation domain-containing protein
VGARGFSLPEVLAALSILGISVLGVQGLLLGLSRAAGTNAHYAVATELAQAELEDLRSLRYGEVTSRSSSATVGGLPFSIDSVVTEGVPQPETKHIHTTVSWVSQGGMGQQFSLETIYAEIRP